jgi:hypothetical protein
MKRSLVVLALVSLVSAGVARAEVRKGDVTLDLLAGWMQQSYADTFDEGDLNVYFGGIRPGVALTDHIRVAGVAAAARITNIIGGDVTTWAFGVSGQYVFAPAGMWSPYIGGTAAWAKADPDGGVIDAVVGDRDGWLLAPSAGLLYTLNTYNNLFGEFQYQFWTGGLDDILDHGFLLVLGIEHKFKVGP